MDEIDDEPIEVPIEDSFDLHSFRPRDVKQVAAAYLEAARARGFERVRLIHGRGIGVQREIIRSLLQTIDYVAAFHDADPFRGGWGATEVVFTPREDRDDAAHEP